VETDTVSTHGRTVEGLPYHYTVIFVSDADGNLVSATASGGECRCRLPDGGVFSVGDHSSFLTDKKVGSWQPVDGLGPVCDALS
jgi:hypothetical protein